MSRGNTPQVLSLLKEREALKRSWIVEAKRHTAQPKTEAAPRCLSPQAWG